MEIKLQFAYRYYILLVNAEDTIKLLKEKIIDAIIKNFPHYNHSFILFYEGQYLEDDKKLSFYNIMKGKYIYITFPRHIKGGGYIDNLEEE